MRPGRHQFAAEQQNAEEARFEEKGGEALVSHQRADNIGGRIRETAPIGAELKRHDNAGNHSKAKRNREDFGPEDGDAEVSVIAGLQVERLEYGDIASQPDRECRKQDVKRDDPEELESRQQHRVERHRASPTCIGQALCPVRGGSDRHPSGKASDWLPTSTFTTVSLARLKRGTLRSKGRASASCRKGFASEFSKSDKPVLHCRGARPVHFRSARVQID